MKALIISGLLIYSEVVAVGQEIPLLIPFQGHLTRPSAGIQGEYEAVPDARYDISFAIYTTPAGAAPIWGPERHEDLVVKGGIVNALLGSIVSFDDALNADPNFFGNVLFVGVTLDADGNPGTADPELVPRETLRPKLHALNTDRLDGRDWRTFFDGTDAQGTVTPGMTKARDTNLFDSIDAGAVFVNPNATVNPKAKTAAVADGLAAGLDLNNNVQVGGAVNFGGDLLGLVQDASGDEGFLRIGDHQICWGRYVSEYSFGTPKGFSPQVVVTPSPFAAPFVDSNYALVVTPFGELPGFPLSRPRAYTASIYDKEPDSLGALNYIDSSGNQADSNRPGWYLAVGRWK